MKKLFVFMKRFTDISNDERWTFPYCHDRYPQNQLFYYLIGKFREQKSTLTTNDFKCVWITCACFRYILVCRHRDHHVLSRARASANFKQLLGRVWSVIDKLFLSFQPSTRFFKRVSRMDFFDSLGKFPHGYQYS